MGFNMNLQCGYEDECEIIDCNNCQKKYKLSFDITLAEICCIEDFATCDLKMWSSLKESDVEIAQEIMFKLMRRIFRIVDEDTYELLE